MDGQNFQNENGQMNDPVNNTQAGSGSAVSAGANTYQDNSYQSSTANAYQDNSYQSNTANTYQDNSYQSNTANTYQDNSYQSSTANAYQDNSYQSNTASTYQDNSYQSNLNTGYRDNSYQSNMSGMYQSGNTYQDNTAAYNATYGNGNSNMYGAQAEAPKTPGVSIASLVLGIAGILFVCCCDIGLIFGIIGLILAIVGNKQQKSGVGTAGLICSIFAIILGAGYLFYMIAVGGASIMQEMM